MADFIHRELYPFQSEGLEFLSSDKDWAKHYQGGHLWDDPGLGKTTQAIAAAHLMGDYPILVVCPNSLKLHWSREIRAIVPGAEVLVATVGGRWRKYSQSAGKLLELSPTVERLQHLGGDRPWVICHYEGVRISEQGYASIPWGTVIIDEAHYIKNKDARRTKALMNVTPSKANRIGLTATPYSKEPSGLWSQLHWMAPGVRGLDNYWRWFNLFTYYTWVEIRRIGSKVIEIEYEKGERPDDMPGVLVRKYRKVVGGHNLEVLAQVMDRFGLCRRKAQVASQLPPITDTMMPLELKNRQEVVYRALADKSRSEFAIKHTSPVGASAPGEPAGVTKIVAKNILSRLTKMERWLSDPQSIDPGCKGAKLEWLEEWASAYPWPAVIVTRFKSTAKRVAELLKVPVISGDIPIKLRDPIIQKWAEGDEDAPQWLVGTIHTLGTGLNLQRAHCLICFDQVHSSILMTQVRDRIHRITTEHPVEVIYLVIEGTSNEVVYESFHHKWRELEMLKRFILMLHGEDWR